jgi:para-aminobenzoate synthetase component 1
MSKRDEAAGKMDRLGAAGEPFLFIVDFAMEQPEVLTPAEAAARGILADIGGKPGAPPLPARAPGFRFRKDPVAYADYRRAFDAVQAELAAGNSYLINLTFSTKIGTELTLADIFGFTAARYRILVPGRFVCFSPEPFVRIADGVISSCPMKGTIDAAVPGAREKVLADPKELAEHTTIVDLIRNDLNGVATGVRVERFRYVETIATNDGDILQVSSLITGRLPDDYRRRIGEILFELLPAGSVTGAPKKKTVGIIERVEPSPRGFYTGVAGYFDGTALESCVLIRFIEETAAGLVYRSGGGITVRSDAEAEYAELVRKVYVPAF